mmetsp:Transcript_89422/g.177770  ORF Transcript_89422/g.177770 Transcript_89422/m.177770 type:complete len:238 (+) Transcript_89422:79-792(+)
MSVRIDIEGLNQRSGHVSCSMPQQVQVQRTMPQPLASMMGDHAWKMFTDRVDSAIEEPAQRHLQHQKCTCIIFAIMIGTFMTAFLSFPVTFLFAASGSQITPLPLFFLPFITWPICFILIFALSCHHGGVMDQLVTNLRTELDNQSRQVQGVTFHLREEQMVTYGRRGSHVHTTYYIEAQTGVAAVAQGVAMPAGYVQVGGGANVTERLANLESLKQKMLITDMEYQSKRAELLSTV